MIMLQWRKQFSIRRNACKPKACTLSLETTICNIVLLSWKLIKTISTETVTKFKLHMNLKLFTLSFFMLFPNSKMRFVPSVFNVMAVFRFSLNLKVQLRVVHFPPNGPHLTLPWLLNEKLCWLSARVSLGRFHWYLSPGEKCLLRWFWFYPGHPGWIPSRRWRPEAKESREKITSQHEFQEVLKILYCRIN